jgi:YggT family protein
VAYVLTLAIFARAILSWFPIDPRNPVVSFLHEITEPILAPLRQVLPRIGFLDLSPLVAIILLQVVARLAADALTG